MINGEPYTSKGVRTVRGGVLGNLSWKHEEGAGCLLYFMPCTFVGWEHPTCSGLGEGNIPEAEKTDPNVIAKYGGYGVDGNKDGKSDPFNAEDAIYSAAHYLSENGAADGDVERAIFAYNKSDQYVADILYYVDEYTKQEQ